MTLFSFSAGGNSAPNFIITMKNYGTKAGSLKTQDKIRFSSAVLSQEGLRPSITQHFQHEISH